MEEKRYKIIKIGVHVGSGNWEKHSIDVSGDSIILKRGFELGEDNNLIIK